MPKVRTTIFVVCLAFAPLTVRAQALKVQDMMTSDEFRGSGLSKLNAAERAALDAWFNRIAERIYSLSVARPLIGEPARVSAGELTDVSSLEGAIIIANDGQFLGKITSNAFDSQSLLNEFGKSGSEFSSTSIFNEFSKYGSEFSGLSPFNEFTSTPPRILKGDRIIGYLTKNTSKTPRLDPAVLMGWVKAHR